MHNGLRYCALNNIDIREHYREDYSAKDFDRPEFRKLLTYLSENKGKIDYLIFTKWDRFSRNLGESITMIKQIKALKTDVLCVEQPIDMNNPDNKVLLAVYLILPEVENDKISSRTKDGMRKAMKEGVFTGIAPFGYKNIRIDKKSTLQIIPERALIIKNALTKYSTGLYSANEIRQEFFSKSSSKYLAKQSFINMVRNPTYAGKIFIKGTEIEPEKMINGLHPEIISYSIFLKNQEIINGKKKFKIQKQRPELLLRGFLECPICGDRLTGSLSRSRNGTLHPYYHCQHGCTYREPAFEINSEILQLFSIFELKPEWEKVLKLAMKGTLKTNDADRINSIKMIDKRIDEINSRKNHLDNLLMDNKILPENYSELNKKCETELFQLKSEKIILSAENNNISMHFDKIINTHVNLMNLYNLSDLDDKRSILGSIFVKKLIYSEKKYRTANLHKSAELIFNNINKLQNMDKKKEAKNSLFNLDAPPSGLEPETL
ncbi:MAG: recombinase family protein [Bacteroidetes bacterium]|nr:recombinase family protein [Bacteroidota bacterium]